MSGATREADRLESLRTYALSAAREQAFDDIARLAAVVCDAPIGLVNVVDQDLVWGKGSYGSLPTYAPRPAGSFCEALVASSADALVVPDAVCDPAWAGTPFVAGADGIRAYAGAPVIGRDGLALGTVCVLDTEARPFTDEQVSDLLALAAQATAVFELHRADVRQHRPTDPVPAAGGGLADPRRLREALERREFVPYFQPIVDVVSGAPVGFEALLRWQHPVLGLVPPAEFLPAIESSGLMLPVGRSVIEQSLDHVRRWRSDFVLPEALTVAVNVSPAQLAAPGLAAFVAGALQARDLPAASLTVELTETLDLLDCDVARTELAELRALGVHVAIDDYGTGHSGLMRLLDLPVSTLKLDRSLTSRLPDDARALAAARSVLGLAHDLAVAVIAEGVETGEQQRALADIGCLHAQGFRFSRPLPAEQIATFLAPWETRPVLAVAEPPRRHARRTPAPTPTPAPGEAPGPTRGSGHSVVLYRSDAELTEAALAHLTGDLASNEALVVVATHSHRRRFETAMTRRGHDVAAWRAARRYLALDADELLASFLDGGRLDADRFRAVVGPLVAPDGGVVHVRVYGEMVARLWESGRRAEAVDLEELWCDLGGRYAFSLLCGYPLAQLAGDDQRGYLQRVIARHAAPPVDGAA
ncbi:MAG: EAL domain-containing protein [Actinomycetales bacterium]